MTFKDITLKDLKDNCFIYRSNVIIIDNDETGGKADWGCSTGNDNLYPLDKLPFAIEDCFVCNIEALTKDEAKQYGFDNEYGTIMIFAVLR